jgi:lysophospholipase L1-like esterase
MRRRSPLVARALLVVMTTLFCVVAAETLLWILEGDAFYGESIARRYVRLREHPPGEKLIRFPDPSYLRATDSLDVRGYPWEIDEDGFILPSGVHSAPDLRIVFLGGSTTECMFVTPEKRFPFLVGRLLEEPLGEKVNSYNGGVSGNNTLHSINILINKVVPMKPDIVVLMENVNDLTILLYEGGYWNENPTRSPLVVVNEQRGEPRRTVWRRFRDIAYALVPRLYVRAVALKDRWRGTAPVLDEFAHLRGRKTQYDAEELRQSFRTVLTMFIDIARSAGIEPVLMTQANRITANPAPGVLYSLRSVEELGIGYDAFRRLYDQFNDIIREVGSQRNVQVIDLEREVPKEREFIYDPVHFNDTGSEVAAAAIARSLLERIQ